MLLRERHEPARRRRLDGVLRPRVLWINPAGTEPVEAFAERIRGDVDVTLLGLRVWGLAPGDRYDMGVELAAVAAAAGSGPVHLAGFSAGATVALAAALALGDSVGSVALLEPAFIGDDDWDPAETGWRAAIGSLRASGPPEQAEALRDMLMAPGETAPPSRRPVAWDYRDDLLGTMLSAHTGFASSDLVRIGAPVILVRGGRSAPRFGVVGRRLAEVCADFREAVFPHLHHFAPPFREQPEQLAKLLLCFWLAATASASSAGGARSVPAWVGTVGNARGRRCVVSGGSAPRHLQTGGNLCLVRVSCSAPPPRRWPSPSRRRVRPPPRRRCETSS